MNDPDPLFSLVTLQRKRMSAVCADIKSFCDSLSHIPLPFPNQHEDDRFLVVVLDGLVQRHIDVFGSMVILERADRIEDVLVLARTLFELSVDAALIFKAIEKNDYLQIPKRISYEWNTNKFKLLKEYPNLTDAQLEEMQARVKKIPGLTDLEHKKIKDQQHFSGLNMRDRCNQVEVGKLYRPVFARLSRHSHGMTFDREMGEVLGLSPSNYRKERIAQECMTLTHSAIILLQTLAMLAPFTGHVIDIGIWETLIDRTTALADEIPKDSDIKS